MLASLSCVRKTTQVGPVIIVIVLVIAIPVSLMVTGAIIAALLGVTIKADVDEQFEGSELLELG